MRGVKKSGQHGHQRSAGQLQKQSSDLRRIYVSYLHRSGAKELNNDPLQLSDYWRRYGRVSGRFGLREHDKTGSIGIIAAEHEPLMTVPHRPGNSGPDARR